MFIPSLCCLNVVKLRGVTRRRLRKRLKVKRAMLGGGQDGGLGSGPNVGPVIAGPAIRGTKLLQGRPAPNDGPVVVVSIKTWTELLLGVQCWICSLNFNFWDVIVGPTITAPTFTPLFPQGWFCYSRRHYNDEGSAPGIFSLFWTCLTMPHYNGDGADLSRDASVSSWPGDLAKWNKVRSVVRKKKSQR